MAFNRKRMAKIKKTNKIHTFDGQQSKNKQN